MVFVGYELRAVIGRRDSVAAVAEELGVRCIDLPQDCALAPWGPDAFDRLGPSDPEREPPGFLYSHVTLLDVAAQWSGPEGLAYVAAEFFGGTGEQGAILWRNGSMEWMHPFSTVNPEITMTPIAAALERLGVKRSKSGDEFAALNLGRHRRTEDWF